VVQSEKIEHPDKAAAAERCVDSDHRIQFYDTTILATKTRYMDRTVRGGIEIELHPNMNRDVGFVSARVEASHLLPQEVSIT
jgi:hypothetical protein